MATPETLGQPIISAETPYEPSINDFKTNVYVSDEVLCPPFDQVVAFNEKHSLTNFSIDQLKKWYIAGAVIVTITTGVKSKIVSMIISFPVILSAEFDNETKDFMSSYSTHLVTDSSFRGHGFASLAITGLIKYGHRNNILSGFHQVSQPAEEMKTNMIPITWWFRILNESRSIKAGYKFPPGKNKHYYTAGLKNTKDLRNPTYTEFHDLVTKSPCDLKLKASEYNYNIMTQTLDCYYIPEFGVIFGLSYLQQGEYTGSPKVKCAHLGLYIDEKNYNQRLDGSIDMDQILGRIYSTALKNGCDLIYIPEISSINAKALESTRAYESASPMYISWYNSGVTGNRRKICLPLF